MSAGLIWSLGILITNTMPVVFEVLHQTHGLGEAQLGRLGAAFVLGGAAVAATGPFWVRRVNGAWVSAAALGCTAIGLIVVRAVDSPAALVAVWCYLGIACSCAATPAFARLGDAPNPIRAYSLALFGSTFIAAMVSFGAPGLIHALGPQSAFVGLAVVFAMGAPCALSLTSAGLQASGGVGAGPATLGGGRPRRSFSVEVVAPPVIAALAGGVFTGVFMGAVYNFCGAISAADGIAAEAVGPLVAAALVGSLAGSAVPSVLGERVNPRSMIGLSILLVSLTYPAMMTHSILLFGLGFVLHGVFSTMGYAYFLGVVRAFDSTDSIYVGYPALQSLGIAGATALAGYILAHGTPGLMFLAALLLNFAAWLGLVLAARLVRSLRVLPA